MTTEIIVNEEKKTLWSRFTSWLASSWLGKAWKSITGLFSSNKTSSKASGAGQAEGKTPDDNERSQGSRAAKFPPSLGWVEMKAAKFHPSLEIIEERDELEAKRVADNDKDLLKATHDMRSLWSKATSSDDGKSQNNDQEAGQQQEPLAFKGTNSVLPKLDLSKLDLKPSSSVTRTAEQQTAASNSYSK